MFREVLAADPNNIEALHRLGLLLGDRGEFAEAALLMERSLGLAPQVPEFYNNLGEVYRKQRRYGDARQAFERAIGLRPAYAEAYNNLALVEMELCIFELAVSSAETGVRLSPELPEAHMTLGQALYLRRRFAEAVEAFKEVTRLRPSWTEALMRQLMARAALGEGLEALLAEMPAGVTGAHVCDAAARGYMATGRVAEAEAAINRGLAIEPDKWSLLCNLANAKVAQGDVEESVRISRRALAIRESEPLRGNMGMSLLKLGRLEEGFRELEFRGKPAAPIGGGVAYPEWDGSDPAGKTILLVPEQGFGDTIQFVRYASQLAARGAKVWVQTPPVLVELVRGVPGVSQVFLNDEAVRGFHAYLHMASLPWAFKTTLETIPAEVPYMRADGAAVATWRDKFTKLGPGLKVGLVWQGNPTHQKDQQRSLPLTALAALGMVAGVRLISLQWGPGREQVGGNGTPELLDLWGQLRTFSDTAAAVSAMDLVIGVDTAVIHLAGALGRPVWSLHAFDCDWRWMVGRTDSPWYPTMRLYRQNKAGEWGEVAEAVARDLEKLGSGE